MIITLLFFSFFSPLISWLEGKNVKGQYEGETTRSKVPSWPHGMGSPHTPHLSHIQLWYEQEMKFYEISCCNLDAVCCRRLPSIIRSFWLFFFQLSMTDIVYFLNYLFVYFLNYYYQGTFKWGKKEHTDLNFLVSQSLLISTVWSGYPLPHLTYTLTPWRSWEKRKPRLREVKWLGQDHTASACFGSKI